MGSEFGINSAIGFYFILRTLPITNFDFFDFNYTMQKYFIRQGCFKTCYLSNLWAIKSEILSFTLHFYFSLHPFNIWRPCHRFHMSRHFLERLRKILVRNGNVGQLPGHSFSIGRPCHTVKAYI